MTGAVGYTRKFRGNTKGKITGSYGIRQAHSYYQRHRPQSSKYTLSDVMFHKICNMVNKRLCDELITNGMISLPANCGSIGVHSYEVKPEFKDGKLLYKVGIDWGKTYELWDNDPEACKNKTRVKYLNEDNLIYQIKFHHPYVHRYKNMKYIRYKPCYSLRKKLQSAIINKEINITYEENYELRRHLGQNSPGSHI